MALEGPQVGVDGWAEPAGELALQLHVLDDGVVAPQSTLVDQILAILRIHRFSVIFAKGGEKSGACSLTNVFT